MLRQKMAELMGWTQKTPAVKNATVACAALATADISESFLNRLAIELSSCGLSRFRKRHECQQKVSRLVDERIAKPLRHENS